AAIKAAALRLQAYIKVPLSLHILCPGGSQRSCLLRRVTERKREREREREREQGCGFYRFCFMALSISTVLFVAAVMRKEIKLRRGPDVESSRADIANLLFPSILFSPLQLHRQSLR
ncbi:uncharacterized, partial [Tachysurus ichikawai]